MLLPQSLWLVLRKLLNWIKNLIKAGFAVNVNVWFDKTNSCFFFSNFFHSFTILLGGIVQFSKLKEILFESKRNFRQAVLSFFFFVFFPEYLLEIQILAPCFENIVNIHDFTSIFCGKVNLEAFFICANDSNSANCLVLLVRGLFFYLLNASSSAIV